jgi:hypothetical protein
MYVGNHTYDHADLTRLSDGRIDREIRHGVHGAWLRPPYGSYNARVEARAHALGYRLCTWTFDTGDWKGYSARSICANVVHNAPKGAVVLMHLNHSAATPHALRCIVHGLRGRGPLDLPALHGHSAGSRHADPAPPAPLLGAARLVARLERAPATGVRRREPGGRTGLPTMYAGGPRRPRLRRFRTARAAPAASAPRRTGATSACPTAGRPPVAAPRSGVAR